MNTIDFTKQGGFPFDQDTLSFLQDSILTAAKAASFGGTLYVLTGCEEAGGNVANGFVVINGEILPFVGGAVQAKVVIVELTEDLLYESGDVYPSIKKRHATFGDDGVTNLLWTDFKRNTSEGVLARLERLERISAPFLPVLDANGVEQRGGMVLWKKPAILIPAGWQEVVDWRGRLPMGYDPADAAFDTVGETGGSKQHYLTTAQLPEHDHSVGSYNKILRTSIAGQNTTPQVDSSGSGTEPDLINTQSLAKVGSNLPFSLLNPYRVVMFIEYTGN